MRDEFAHGLLDLPVRIQRGLEEVDVELHAERLQVHVLFASQIGDGELADRVETVGIFRAGHRMIFEFDRVAAQIGVRDIADIVAAISVSRPACVVGRHTLCACLH